MGPLWVSRICRFGRNLSAVSGNFPHFSGVTDYRFCKIATVTLMADKIAQSTDISDLKTRGYADIERIFGKMV